MSRAFAAAVVRLRWFLAPLWIGGAVAVYLFAPGFEEGRQSALGQIIPQSAEAIETQRAIVERFGFPLLTQNEVVFRDPDGFDAAELARLAAFSARAALAPPDALDGLVAAVPLVSQPGVVPGSREPRTTVITYLFTARDVDQGRARAIADAFQRLAPVGEEADTFAGITGTNPARLRAAELIRSSLRWVELATLAFIVAIVGANFRSLVTPVFVPGAAIVAFVASQGLTAWIGRRVGFAVPHAVEPVLFVLVLGLVADYSIFFLTGVRRQLADGAERLDAVRASTRAYAPVVFTAGLIVAGTTASLYTSSLGFFRALGPALAIAALTSMAVSLTFVPAVLALLGRFAYWPSAPAAATLRGGGDDGWEAQLERTWRARVARWASDRRKAAAMLVGSALALGGAASGLWFLTLGLSPLEGLPAESEPQRAFAAAREGFAPGIVAPTELVLRAPGIAERDEAIAELEAALARQPGVAGVIGPGTLPVDVPRVFAAPGGDAVRLLLVLDDAPPGGPAIATLERLQPRLPALLDRAGLANAQPAFAGVTALALDTVQVVRRDFPWIVLAAIGVSLVALVALLRSVVAPLFLVASTLLAVAAALGLTALLFERFLGRGEVTYLVPLAIGVLLLSFGSDYNVFVTGRIWDAARERPLREAIAYAAPRASRAIAIAGLTLAGSFALLAIVPLQVFREMAFALAAGVLIDVFVVRIFLVPAMLSLTGRWSAWPGRLGG